MDHLTGFFSGNSNSEIVSFPLQELEEGLHLLLIQCGGMVPTD